MSTAQKIVNESLRILNLNNGLLPVQPRSQKVGFDYLADLLLRYRGDGIYITPQIPPTVNSELREQSWARIGLIYDLAFHIAAPLQVQSLPPTFAAVREDSLRTLYIQGRPSTEQSYPDTLPVGGGNFTDNGSGYTFYSAYGKDLDFEVRDKRRSGESLVYYADFDADAVMRNTSVSSVGWKVVRGSSVTVSSASFTDNLAEATLTFSGCGQSTVSATATYASGEVKSYLMLIEVVEA